MGFLQLLAPVVFLTGKILIKIGFSHYSFYLSFFKKNWPPWCSVVGKKAQVAVSYLHTPNFHVLVAVNVQFFNHFSSLRLQEERHMSSIA